MNPLVLLVGPTGSGKSALALALAAQTKGAILNCDSLQAYQRLDIGTAKPTEAERSRVPHFLFDVLKPGAILTAGDFRLKALEVLHRELPQRMTFGVGGSGFYIQALEKGMFDVPKPNPETEMKVRSALEKNGLDSLYAELVRLDPEYAQRIGPADSYRIVRALIIIQDSGKKVSDVRLQFKPQKFPFPLLKLGLMPEREELLRRVEHRAQNMLDQGLLKEVQDLLDEGYAEWPPLQSVGYKECRAFLQGRLERKKL